KLRGLRRDELPSFLGVMMDRGHLFIPLAILIGFLMVGFTPLYAALMAMGACVIVAGIRKATRMGPKDVIDCLESGAKNALGVVIACATAGIIVGVVTLTGLGLKLGNGLIDLAAGNLLLTLFFTMISSLILGMGAPTTANYIITSTIAAPALIMMQVHPMAAHLFVFYFGIIADLTPPVALAAFAGAGIAGSDPMKTGFTATKLAIGAFLIPYMFAYNPTMLLIGSTTWGMIQTLCTSCLGMSGVGAAMIGYLLTNMKFYERVWFFVGGIMLIHPGTVTDLVGVSVLVVGVLYQWRKSKAEVGEPVLEPMV
ncbi:MAG: TRAP transporter fused permease subunit, partial [Syntrophobacteraceae bacterium]